MFRCSDAQRGAKSFECCFGKVVVESTLAVHIQGLRRALALVPHCGVSFQEGVLLLLVDLATIGESDGAIDQHALCKT